MATAGSAGAGGGGKSEAMRPWETAEWAALAAHARTAAPSFHLPALLSQRTLTATFDTWTLDYSRQLVTAETLALLQALAARVDLPARIAAMAGGERINTSEGRSVLHTALRCGAGESLVVEGRDVCADVRGVQERIQAFVAGVRSGAHVGASGKPLRNIVSIGIGGSYLGVEFAYEALRMDATAQAQAEGYRLRFLANVDPTDAARALEVRSKARAPAAPASPAPGAAPLPPLTPAVSPAFAPPTLCRA
jgi:glucose-6-phosphate isomerase